MRKKTSVKYYEYGAPLAHFIMQPSRRVQRMHAVALEPEKSLGGHVSIKTMKGSGWAKVEWLRGRDLAPIIRRHKYGILDELAALVADHLRLGVMHGDIHSGNMVALAPSARRRRRSIVRPIRTQETTFEEKGGIYVRRLRLARPIRLKAIDYGFALPFHSDVGKKREGVTQVVDYTADYHGVVHNIVPMLAKGAEERKRLESYFERKFLERVERL